MKPIATKQRYDSHRRYKGQVWLHWIILGVVVVGLPAMILTVGTKVTGKRGPDTQVMSCYPDGSAHYRDPFDTESPPKQAWMPSLFLSVTLGFGTFTFSEAKVIDVAWDLVVGRGGQFLLTLVTYPVVRRVLQYRMETTPATFRLFSSIALGHSLSFSSLHALCTPPKAFVRRICLHSALVLIGLYLLAFPTILSIMTSYQANLVPYALDPLRNTSLVDVSNLTMPRFVVVDGHRVGLNDYFRSDSVVRNETQPSNNLTFIDLLDTYAGSLDVIRRTIDYTLYGYTYSDLEYSFSMWDEFQFSGWGAGISMSLDNGTMTVVYTIPAENMTDVGFSFVYPWNATSLDQVWSNITLPGLFSSTTNLSPPPLDVHPNLAYAEFWSASTEHYIWTPSGETMLNTSWLLTNGVCQPGNTYRWGFSASVLLLFLTLTAIFTILVMRLRWYVYDKSRAERYEQDFCVYRDVLDLAEELKAQLGAEVQEMSSTELKARTREVRGQIKFETSHLIISRSEQYWAAVAQYRLDGPRRRLWAGEFKERERDSMNELKALESREKAASKASKSSAVSAVLSTVKWPMTWFRNTPASTGEIFDEARAGAGAYGLKDMDSESHLL
ncbi:hypothetical protein LTR17_003958 [Elasticomyces elasticus]|nr:hypothetical protein LTR17_003958 [Elasticomyces elasticus]